MVELEHDATSWLSWHLPFPATPLLCCILVATTTSKLALRSLQVNWAYGYWAGDLDMKCYQGWHLTLVLALGVPGVLLLCLGVPATLVLLLFRSRLQRNQPIGVYKFGFLLACYR
jgi:hypothetical protein